MDQLRAARNKLVINRFKYAAVDKEIYLMEDITMKMTIDLIVDMLAKSLDFTNKIVDKFDDEKYAKAVMEIYGHDPDNKELDKLAEMIMNATDISTDEKSALLLAIADKRLEIKKGCAEIVDRGSEKRCEIAKKLALGVFTGGISVLFDVSYDLYKRANKERIEM